MVAVAAGAPLAMCASLAVFRESVRSTTDALVLVLIVVAAASTGVRAAGIVAAGSSGLSFDILLVEPYGQLTINDPNDVEALVLLVLIGAAVTEVALWGHRQQARASRRVLDPDIPVLDHRGVVTRRGNGMPTDDEIALLVSRGNTTLGHFLLTASAEIARPSLEQRKVAVLLANQVGAVVASPQN